MTRDEVRELIKKIGILPSVRVTSRDLASFGAETVYSSGIPIVEITMTTPGALEVINDLATRHADLAVGAGTVLDVKTARACLDAGAGFITSPGLDLEIVEFAVMQDVVVIPGVLTPSEVMAAVKAGADFVKLFPCAQIGGVAYLRALRPPFPQIPFIAAGGVNQQTAAEYIHAGAAALGIGADLIPPRAIEAREQGWILELARRFSQLVKNARAELPVNR